MSESVVAEVTLPAVPTTVGRARRAVRRALAEAGGSHLLDPSELVVSELVTNAVVHAGTEVTLRITAEHDSLRVEIEDANPHVPVRRTWARTAGTGRGLMIVDDQADRWGCVRTDTGKVVWFEIGSPTAPLRLVPAPEPRPDTVEVTLIDLPVLMHWAWQEHASALLREYLLHTLDEDAHAILRHAAASDALSILDEQLPAPDLPADPDALMASSIEPTVTADSVALRVSHSSVPHFEVLDELLTQAISAAQEGRLLGPPTQPEISELRSWLCAEVAGQAGRAEPTPWRARTDVRVPLAGPSGRPADVRELAGADLPMLATNEASVIIAVTASLVEFLGYHSEADLLGRRILVVVPARFHQAHIAGTTLNATNGRDVLLDQWLTVPIVRADGSEVLVSLRVRARRVDDDRVFVAEFELPRA